MFQEQQPWKDASDDLLLRANGDEGMGRSSHAIADFNACALAYQLTGDPVYAQKSIELLNAWAYLNTRYSGAGRLGWVQPPSGEPGISHESDTAPYGVGLFLLAGSELFRLVSR